MKKLLLALFVVLLFSNCSSFDGFDINGDGEPDGTHFPPEDWDKFIDATKSKVVYEDNGTEKSTPLTLLAGTAEGRETPVIGAARGIITSIDQYKRFEITIKFVGKYYIHFADNTIPHIYGESNGSTTEVLVVNENYIYEIDGAAFFIEYYAEEEVDNETPSIHYQNIRF